MKTYSDLYPQICEFDNLLLAYRKARRGKRDKKQVYQFEFDYAGELLELQEELQHKTYTPGAYHSFRLDDRKKRLVSAAPFRDRVVHHALCNIIEPLFERKFIFDSYANRKKKGTHRALDRAQHFARQHKYVLQADIAQYFPSIDHALLRAILARTLQDDDVLWLIDQILASGANIHRELYRMHYFAGDDLFAVQRPRGLPIGNLTSQFWANVYLNELDQFVKRELKCAAYVRYVDDFVLFANEKQVLWDWRGHIETFLERLRLVTHPRKTVIYPAQNGLPFLGFRVYPTHRRLKRDNVRDFVKRFRAQTKQYARGETTLEKITLSTQCWIAHAKHGNTYKLRAALFQKLLV